jgi:hypothetical protein
MLVTDADSSAQGNRTCRPSGPRTSTSDRDRIGCDAMLGYDWAWRWEGAAGSAGRT